jgi:predicted MPP superfamily phosphohydrolase
MIGVTLFVLGYTAVKTVWHTNIIQEHVVEYNPDVSPEEPIRIVHISDLHVDKYTNGEKLNRYIQRVRDTNPAMIIFTGDLITSGLDYVEEAADALASIETSHGIYAVLGDHDYWSGEEEIVAALEQKGIRVLRNENRRIEVNGTTVKLTGITEIYSSRPGDEEIEDLVSDSGSDALKILFAHQASNRLIRYAQESGTDLLLGGHTHGGQIRIPIFFYPVTAVMEETKYIRHEYKLDNLLLNVNSGLGFTLSPVRYNAPADYSVINIR